jgi:hypothetical protein
VFIAACQTSHPGSKEDAKSGIPKETAGLSLFRESEIFE